MPGVRREASQVTSDDLQRHQASRVRPQLPIEVRKQVEQAELAACKDILTKRGGACESLRLSPCVLVQPDGWARGEREGYGGPRDVTSLSLSRG